MFGFSLKLCFNSVQLVVTHHDHFTGTFWDPPIWDQVASPRPCFGNEGFLEPPLLWAPLGHPLRWAMVRQWSQCQQLPLIFGFPFSMDLGCGFPTCLETWETAPFLWIEQPQWRLTTLCRHSKGKTSSSKMQNFPGLHMTELFSHLLIFTSSTVLTLTPHFNRLKLWHQRFTTRLHLNVPASPTDAHRGCLGHGFNFVSAKKSKVQSPFYRSYDLRNPYKPGYATAYDNQA